MTLVVNGRQEFQRRMQGGESVAERNSVGEAERCLRSGASSARKICELRSIKTVPDRTIRAEVCSILLYPDLWPGADRAGLSAVVIITVDLNRHDVIDAVVVSTHPA